MLFRRFIFITLSPLCVLKVCGGFCEQLQRKKTLASGKFGLKSTESVSAVVLSSWTRLHGHVTTNCVQKSRFSLYKISLRLAINSKYIFESHATSLSRCVSRDPLPLKRFILAPVQRSWRRMIGSLVQLYPHFKKEDLVKLKSLQFSVV